MAQIVISAVLGLLAAGAFVIAFFQFRERGPIFTNAYLMATPNEREALDKKAEYRLAARVFTGVGLLFGLALVGMVTGWRPAFWLAVAGGILLAVYAVVNAVRSGKFR